MSTGAQQVSGKLDILIDLNKKLLLAIEKNGTAGKGGKAEAPKSKITDDDAKKLTGLAGAVKDLVTAAKDADAIKPASATKIVKFYETFTKGITVAMKDLDVKKTQDFTAMMKVLVEGAGKLMKSMALAAVLSPLAIIGAKVFGFILTGLVRTISRLAIMSPLIIAGLASLFGMATNIGIFMLVMAGTALLAPKIALGTLVFITVIFALAGALRLVSRIAGDGAGFVQGPLGSLLKMGKAIAMFSLAMILIGVLAPQVALGALAFITVILALSGALRLVSRIAGDGAGFNQGPLGSLLKMGRAIAMFALGLILIGLLAQQVAIGALVFITVILALSGALRLVSLIAGDGTGFSKGPLGALLKMGKAILMFSLGLIIMAIAAPLIAIGALVFILVIAALAISLKLISMVVGDGEGMKKGPLGSLMKLSKAVLIFSLTFVLVGFFVQQFAIGALAVILSLMALSVAMELLGVPLVKKGIANLRGLSISLLIFTGAMAVWSLLVTPRLTWESIAMMAAVIIGLGLAAYVLGMFDKEVKKGAAVLKELSIALAIFSVGMLIFSLAAKNLTWESLGMMAAVIVGLGLAAYVLGQVAVEPFAIAGALVLIALGAALLVFSIGFLVMAAASKMLTTESVKNMGLAILTIGLSMVPIGLVSPLVILGAAAMVVAAVALLPIAASLAIFSAIGWTENDGKSLQNALQSIQLGMMGLTEMPSGLGWIKAGINVVAMSAGVLLSSYAMVVAGVSLLLIAPALRTFKKIEWTEENSNSLKFALASIGNAFADLAEGDRFYSIRRGIFSMRDVGGTLISLASGIEAMANMTFTEYVYDEKTSQLQPKNKIKLTKDDVTLAGDNASYVISALSGPLSHFGDLMNGSSKGGGFFQRIGLSKNGIQLGIEALSSLGNGLVSLAGGVQDWANMSITTYTIGVDKNTGLNVLMPKEKKPMKPEDIKTAASNIAYVISAMITPMTQLGEMMDGSAGGDNVYGARGFTAANIKKGIEAFSGFAGSIADLATGVVNWANMSVTTYKVDLDKKTGLNVLVPDKVTPIGKTEITAATENISLVISGLLKPMMNLGNLMEGGGGWFSDNGFDAEGIEKGVSVLANMSTSIGGLADNIVKFASMSYVEMEVKKDPKTKLNVLVPGKVVKITAPMITAASNTISTVMGVALTGIKNFLKDLEAAGGEDVINAAMEVSKELVSGFGDVYEKLAKTMSASEKDVAKVMDNWKCFLDKFSDSFDGAQKKFPNYAVAEKYLGIAYRIALQGGSAAKELIGNFNVPAAIMTTVMTNWKTFLEKFSDAFTDASTMLKNLTIANGFMPMLMPLVKTAASTYNTIHKIFGNGPQIQIVMGNWNYFFEQLNKPMRDTAALSRFAMYNQLMTRHIANTAALNKQFLEMNKQLNFAVLYKYDKFTSITERLSKTVGGFERFVKAFGTMAVDMGVFATNFSVMGPDGIMAFKDWTNSMVSISQVDISKSTDITGFVNDVVSAAFKGGGSKDVPEDKPAQKLTSSEKSSEIAAQKGKGAGGGGGAEGGTGGAPMDTKAITTAITAAIKAAFTDLTVTNMTVMKTKER